MAEIFANPLSLIFHAGKNLLLNGVDIFDKIAAAVNSYGQGDFKSFGKNVATAMEAVFLNAPYVKKEYDAKAFEFFAGFYD